MMIENNIEHISNAGMTFHGSIPRVMGTRFEMVISGLPKEDVHPLWGWACVELSCLDRMLNRFDPGSEISRINVSASQATVMASSRLESLVREAMRWWKLTGGLFDVTKGGMGDVSLDEGGLLSLNGHTLDFGGFAKGYFLRELKGRMVALGVSCAFVDFGGSSIMALGHHPFGDCWKVGVRDPFGGKVVGEVELKDQSLSTSGNTPGYSGHIVNPLNGETPTGKVLVSVVSDDPLEAEILSTAAAAGGRQAAEALSGAFPASRIDFIAG